jgi:hypothetical protein
MQLLEQQLYQDRITHVGKRLLSTSKYQPDDATMDMSSIMRAGARGFRRELTLSFVVDSLPVDHAPFDPANFSLTAPLRGASFFGGFVMALPRRAALERGEGQHRRKQAYGSASHGAGTVICLVEFT